MAITLHSITSSSQQETCRAGLTGIPTNDSTTRGVNKSHAFDAEDVPKVGQSFVELQKPFAAVLAHCER